jgi:hypothetical protein
MPFWFEDTAAPGDSSDSGGGGEHRPVLSVGAGLLAAAQCLFMMLPLVGSRA